MRALRYLPRYFWILLCATGAVVALVWLLSRHESRGPAGTKVPLAGLQMPKSKERPKKEDSETRDDGDFCVSLISSSLRVIQANSGYRVANEKTELPITLASSRRANAFLAESTRHAGICWNESITDDLKSGYDVYLIWQPSLPRFDTTIPLLPSSQSSPVQGQFGATCESHLVYKIEQDDENGPAYLRDSSANLLIFDSRKKAQRAYDDLTTGDGSADLCKLNTSDTIENKTGPFIAYRSN